MGFVSIVSEPIIGADGVFIETLPILNSEINKDAILYYLNDIALWKYEFGYFGENNKLKLPPKIEFLLESELITRDLVPVVSDSQGNVITQGVDKIVDNFYKKTIIKISPEGKIKFSVIFGNFGISSLAIDKYDNIYLGTGAKNMIKMSSTGSVIWTYSVANGVINSIAVLDSLEVYIAHNNFEITKVSSIGQKIWSKKYSNQIGSIAIDILGNITTAGWGGDVAILSSDGILLNSLKFEQYIRGIVVDKSNNRYICGSRSTIDKISELGEKIWSSAIHGGKPVYGMSVGDDNSICTSGETNRIIKLSSIGEIVYNFDNTIVYPNCLLGYLTIDVNNNIWVWCRTTNNAPYATLLEKFQQNLGGLVLNETPKVTNKIYKTDVVVKELTGVLPYSFTVYKTATSAVYTVIASDNSNNIYASNNTGTIQKISANGNIVWEFFNDPSEIRCIEVDKNNILYYGGLGKTVRKISANGEQIWAFTGHSNTVDSIKVDKLGNVYSGSYDNTMRKISADGVELWQVQRRTSNIALDKYDNIYSSSTLNSSDAKIIRWATDGTEIWDYNDSYVGVLAVDKDSNIHYDGKLGLTKLSKSGIFLKSFKPEWLYHQILIDNNNNVYILDRRVDDSDPLQRTYLIKLDTNYNKIWEYSIDSGSISKKLIYTMDYKNDMYKWSTYSGIEKIKNNTTYDQFAYYN